MPQSQFVRAQVYSPGKIEGILSEADRLPGFTSHIPQPLPAVWRLGSRTAVDVAVAQYMSKPAALVQKNGKPALRKRRKDHRCLVAGVASWPDPMTDFARDSPRLGELRPKLRDWLHRTETWLDEQFGDQLVAICLHQDEGRPHIHFFAVGDAQRLHPGLRAELVNNARIVEPLARFNAHKAGLRAWLDDYQEHVGQHMGLERTLNSKPAWRIRDRGVRAKLLEIDALLKARPDADIQIARNAVWDTERKTDHETMRF